MANAVQDVALGRTSERGGEHVDVMPNRRADQDNADGARWSCCQDGAERGCVRGLDTVLLACVARDWLCPCFSNESGELAHLF